MRKQIITILAVSLLCGVLTAGSIKVISPNNGEKLVLGSSYFIKWNSSGLKKGLKITLWRNKVVLGVIARNVNAIKGMFNWKVGNYGAKTAPIGSGYMIKIKEIGTPVADMSDRAFSIITNKAPSSGIIRVNKMPTINSTVKLDPKYQIKKPVFKPGPPIKPEGSLKPNADIGTFGQPLTVKMYFKNALKVRVWNRTTGELIYTKKFEKPETGTRYHTINKLNYIKTKLEMEVSYISAIYTQCIIYARPVVNKFEIGLVNPLRHNVYYSFSACDFAYLKKYDKKKQRWIRVAKLTGDVSSSRSITKEGTHTIILRSYNSKTTKYKLVLIGDIKQGGVVNSKVLERHFWTNDSIE